MKNTIVLCLLIASTFIGCKKDAGLGGSANIAVFPEHHGKNIPNSTAYIKFNSKEAPASLSEYDLVESASSNHPDHIHFDGLKPGDYFIYCVGYDSAISEICKGGMPYTIEKKDKSKAVDLKVAITE
jgi:hypothetical protein